MLATIGIVDCIFRRVGLRPFILVYGEQPFYFRLDGAEQNENVTIFLSPTVYCHLINCVLYAQQVLYYMYNVHVLSASALSSKSLARYPPFCAEYGDGTNRFCVLQSIQ